ncbi:hypothetical protein C942_00495 [Photobacterium marinum]|uniref:Uncharacterized protein n=1 Tax=Photobacterium marinum TaxID=1056511 RepID=L8JCN0_9GAMM|nr:hypothetical protein [Photobacterium marinum]ELR66053.1 hypothetical protein C942_00495 [Photobacterium marinum]
MRNEFYKNKMDELYKNKESAWLPLDEQTEAYELERIKATQLLRQWSTI